MGKSDSFLIAKLVSFLLLAGSFCTFAAPDGNQKCNENSRPEIIPHGCSVITLAKGDQVLFGGNDDYIDLDSYYWVDPGYGEYYGVIWIGYPDNVQQGVNEHGLAYDANGLPRKDVNPHLERMAVSGDYTIYPIRIMRECKSVQEVIDWVNTHQWHSFMHDQMHFADAGGDAVIISAGKDGEIAFTRKDSGDGFLVSTNFNVVNPSNGFGYPCWRYDLANEMLDKILHDNDELSLNDMVSVMDAIHQEGVNGWTKETMIADLKEGLVYLYYFYQYDEPVILNVKKELENPREAGPLSSLFPDSVVEEAIQRYEELQNSGAICLNVGRGWTIAVLLSLVILLFFLTGIRSERWMWLVFVLILGPVALCVFFLVRKPVKNEKWKLALIEATGDVVPLVIAFMILMSAIVIVYKLEVPIAAQIVMVGGMPMLIGWIIFPAAFLFNPGKQNIFRFWLQRLPHAIIVINLGLAGVFAVSMALVNRSMQVCKVMPFSLSSLMTWWVIYVLGVLFSGIIFLFIYEYLSVKAGYLSWSALLLNKDSITQRNWRTSWQWIVLSYLALALSIFLGMIFFK